MGWGITDPSIDDGCATSWRDCQFRSRDEGSRLRDRIAVLVGFFIFLVLATLGPGLIARRGQLIGCSIDVPGCPGSADEKSFAYQADDGRVEGNSGDLIVLYCQPQYRTISVYGIVKGVGVHLTSFDVDAVRAAGVPGLTVNLGEQGVVSMRLTAENTLFIALKGGLVAAAGLDTYAKVFHCAF